MIAQTRLNRYVMRTLTVLFLFFPFFSCNFYWPFVDSLRIVFVTAVLCAVMAEMALDFCREEKIFWNRSSSGKPRNLMRSLMSSEKISNHGTFLLPKASRPNSGFCPLSYVMCTCLWSQTAPAIKLANVPSDQ